MALPALTALLITASTLTPSDWRTIERHPELSEYIGAHDFADIADRMHTGEWYRPATYQADLPEYQDAKVEFGSGE